MSILKTPKIAEELRKFNKIISFLKKGNNIVSIYGTHNSYTLDVITQKGIYVYYITRDEGIEIDEEKSLLSSIHDIINRSGNRPYYLVPDSIIESLKVNLNLTMDIIKEKYEENY